MNTKQNRIEHLKGALTHDVDFGYGLLGRLRKGGTFEIVCQQIAPGIWSITTTHIHIQGRALIFKSISEEQDEVASAYHPTPASLSLADAAKMLQGRVSRADVALDAHTSAHLHLSDIRLPTWRCRRAWRRLCESGADTCSIPADMRRVFP